MHTRVFLVLLVFSLLFLSSVSSAEPVTTAIFANRVDETDTYVVIDVHLYAVGSASMEMPDSISNDYELELLSHGLNYLPIANAPIYAKVDDSVTSQPVCYTDSDGYCRAVISKPKSSISSAVTCRDIIMFYGGRDYDPQSFTNKLFNNVISESVMDKITGSNPLQGTGSTQATSSNKPSGSISIPGYEGEDLEFSPSSSTSIQVCSTNAGLLASGFSNFISSLTDPSNRTHPIVNMACMGFFLMFGLLIAALYLNGRDPFRLLDITSPRLPTAKNKVSFALSLKKNAYTKAFKEFKKMSKQFDKMRDGVIDNFAKTLSLLENPHGGSKRLAHQYKQRLTNIYDQTYSSIYNNMISSHRGLEEMPTTDASSIDTDARLAAIIAAMKAVEEEFNRIKQDLESNLSAEERRKFNRRLEKIYAARKSFDAIARDWANARKAVVHEYQVRTFGKVLKGPISDEQLSEAATIIGEIKNAGVALGEALKVHKRIANKIITTPVVNVARTVNMATTARGFGERYARAKARVRHFNENKEKLQEIKKLQELISLNRKTGVTEEELKNAGLWDEEIANEVLHPNGGSSGESGRVNTAGTVTMISDKETISKYADRLSQKLITESDQLYNELQQEISELKEKAGSNYLLKSAADDLEELLSNSLGRDPDILKDGVEANQFTRDLEREIKHSAVMLVVNYIRKNWSYLIDDPSLHSSLEYLAGVSLEKLAGRDLNSLDDKSKDELLDKWLGNFFASTLDVRFAKISMLSEGDDPLLGDNVKGFVGEISSRLDELELNKVLDGYSYYGKLRDLLENYIVPNGYSTEAVLGDVDDLLLREISLIDDIDPSVISTLKEDGLSKGIDEFKDVTKIGSIEDILEQHLRDPTSHRSEKRLAEIRMEMIPFLLAKGEFNRLIQHLRDQGIISDQVDREKLSSALNKLMFAYSREFLNLIESNSDVLELGDLSDLEEGDLSDLEEGDLSDLKGTPKLDKLTTSLEEFRKVMSNAIADAIVNNGDDINRNDVLENLRIFYRTRGVTAREWSMIYSQESNDLRDILFRRSKRLRKKDIQLMDKLRLDNELLSDRSIVRDWANLSLFRRAQGVGRWSKLYNDIFETSHRAGYEWSYFNAISEFGRTYNNEGVRRQIILREAYDILGIPLEDLMGKNAQDVLDDLMDRVHTILYFSYIEGMRMYAEELRRRGLDGSKYYEEVNLRSESRDVNIDQSLMSKYKGKRVAIIFGEVFDLENPEIYKMPHVMFKIVKHLTPATKDYIRKAIALNLRALAADRELTDQYPIGDDPVGLAGARERLYSRLKSVYDDLILLGNIDKFSRILESTNLSPKVDQIFNIYNRFAHTDVLLPGVDLPVEAMFRFGFVKENQKSQYRAMPRDSARFTRGTIATPETPVNLMTEYEILPSKFELDLKGKSLWYKAGKFITSIPPRIITSIPFVGNIPLLRSLLRIDKFNEYYGPQLVSTGNIEYVDIVTDRLLAKMSNSKGFDRAMAMLINVKFREMTERVASFGNSLVGGPYIGTGLAPSAATTILISRHGDLKFKGIGYFRRTPIESKAVVESGLEKEFVKLSEVYSLIGKDVHLSDRNLRRQIAAILFEEKDLIEHPEYFDDPLGNYLSNLVKKIEKSKRKLRASIEGSMEYVSRERFNSLLESAEHFRSHHEIPNDEKTLLALLSSLREIARGTHRFSTLGGNIHNLDDQSWQRIMDYVVYGNRRTIDSVFSEAVHRLELAGVDRFKVELVLSNIEKYMFLFDQEGQETFRELLSFVRGETFNRNVLSYVRDTISQLPAHLRSVSDARNHLFDLSNYMMPADQDLRAVRVEDLTHMFDGLHDFLRSLDQNYMSNDANLHHEMLSFRQLIEFSNLTARDLLDDLEQFREVVNQVNEPMENIREGIPRGSKEDISKILEAMEKVVSPFHVAQSLEVFVTKEKLYLSESEDLAQMARNNYNAVLEELRIVVDDLRGHLQEVNMENPNLEEAMNALHGIITNEDHVYPDDIENIANLLEEGVSQFNSQPYVADMINRINNLLSRYPQLNQLGPASNISEAAQRLNIVFRGLSSQLLNPNTSEFSSLSPYLKKPISSYKDLDMLSLDILVNYDPHHLKEYLDQVRSIVGDQFSPELMDRIVNAKTSISRKKLLKELFVRYYVLRMSNSLGEIFNSADERIGVENYIMERILRTPSSKWSFELASQLLFSSEPVVRIHRLSSLYERFSSDHTRLVDALSEYRRYLTYKEYNEARISAFRKLSPTHFSDQFRSKHRWVSMLLSPVLLLSRVSVFFQSYMILRKRMGAYAEFNRFLKSGNLIELVGYFDQRHKERMDETFDKDLKKLNDAFRAWAFRSERMLLALHGLYSSFSGRMHTRLQNYGVSWRGYSGMQFAGPIDSTPLQVLGAEGNSKLFRVMLFAPSFRKAVDEYNRRFMKLREYSSIPQVYDPMGRPRGPTLQDFIYESFGSKVARVGELTRTYAKETPPEYLFTFLFSRNASGSMRIWESLDLIYGSFRSTPYGPRDILNYTLYKPNDLENDFKDMLYTLKEGRSMKKSAEHLYDVGVYGTTRHNKFIAGREISLFKTYLNKTGNAMYPNRITAMFDTVPYIGLPGMYHLRYSDIYNRVQSPSQLISEDYAYTSMTSNSFWRHIEGVLWSSVAPLTFLGFSWWLGWWSLAAGGLYVYRKYKRASGSVYQYYPQLGGNSWLQNLLLRRRTVPYGFKSMYLNEDVQLGALPSFYLPNPDEDNEER